MLFVYFSLSFSFLVHVQRLQNYKAQNTTPEVLETHYDVHVVT